MSTAKAFINPRMITWARNRAGMSEDTLANKVLNKAKNGTARVIAWEMGEDSPTFGQAQSIAKYTHIPFGFLYLKEPPKEELPIPDLRTIDDRRVVEMSPELRDVVRQIMQKQAWYKEYLTIQQALPLEFVGRFTRRSDVHDVVDDIRNVIGVPLPTKGSTSEYFSNLVHGAENAGVLVMRSGVVENYTRRTLKVEEVRGFAICDELAPVVFVNSADSEEARLFTLIHELAHLWINSSGISNLEGDRRDEEIFCNDVAGEFLVPRLRFMELWSDENTPMGNIEIIRSELHVSIVAAARRALMLGKITKEFYWQLHHRYAHKKSKGRGNYHNNVNARNGRLLGSAVKAEALSGRLLLKDAGQLLGVKPNRIRDYAVSE